MTFIFKSVSIVLKLATVADSAQHWNVLSHKAFAGVCILLKVGFMQPWQIDKGGNFCITNCLGIWSPNKNFKSALIQAK